MSVRKKCTNLYSSIDFQCTLFYTVTVKTFFKKTIKLLMILALLETLCSTCVLLLYYFDVSHSKNKNMSKTLVQSPLFDTNCFGQVLSAQPTRIDVLHTGPVKYYEFTRHANRIFIPCSYIS